MAMFKVTGMRKESYYEEVHKGSLFIKHRDCFYTCSPYKDRGISYDSLPFNEALLFIKRGKLYWSNKYEK